MARAIHHLELRDPDISWLMSAFEERSPGFILIEQEDGAILFIPNLSSQAALACEYEENND